MSDAQKHQAALRLIAQVLAVLLRVTIAKMYYDAGFKRDEFVGILDDSWEDMNKIADAANGLPKK